MSNDMNRPEAELNEAALSGVSGGASVNPELARSHAKQLCCMCRGLGRSACDHEHDLPNYIQKNGPFSRPEDCPYFNQ